MKSPDSLLTDLFEGFQHKTADTLKGGANIFRPTPLNLLQHRNSKETAGTDQCKSRELKFKPSAEVSTSPTSFGLVKKQMTRQVGALKASRFVKELTRQTFDFKPLLLRRENSMYQVADKTVLHE